MLALQDGGVRQDGWPTVDGEDAAAGEEDLRVFLVGLPQSQIDRLEAMQLVPDLMPRANVFGKFEEFRRELPGILEKLT